MKPRIRTNGEIYIIDITGEIALYDANQLKELITKMIEKKVERFIINVKEVRTIDSSGIGAFIFIASTLKKMDCKLAVVNVQGAVKAVLEKTKLSGYFPLYTDMDKAIQDLS
jgi:anti-sigma B factor antagonist